MYNRSVTVVRCCIGAGKRFVVVHNGSTLREMTSWPPFRNSDVKPKIQLRTRYVFTWRI